MKEYHGGIPHTHTQWEQYYGAPTVHRRAHMDVAREAIMVYKAGDDTKYACFPQVSHESVVGKNWKICHKFSTQGFLKFKSHKQA